MSAAVLRQIAEGQVIGGGNGDFMILSVLFLLFVILFCEFDLEGELSDWFMETLVSDELALLVSRLESTELNDARRERGYIGEIKFDDSYVLAEV